MFDCPNCKEDCKRLIGVEKLQKIFCEKCFDRKDDHRPTYLHEKFPGAEAKGLTVAKAEIIANRRISRDDKLVIIDKRTGKETQY